MIERERATQASSQSIGTRQQQSMVQIPITIPLAPKLELSGNLSAAWKKCYRVNYEIAAQLKDTGDPTASKEL